MKSRLMLTVMALFAATWLASHVSAQTAEEGEDKPRYAPSIATDSTTINNPREGACATEFSNLQKTCVANITQDPGISRPCENQAEEYSKCAAEHNINFGVCNNIFITLRPICNSSYVSPDKPLQCEGLVTQFLRCVQQ